MASCRKIVDVDSRRYNPCRPEAKLTMFPQSNDRGMIGPLRERARATLNRLRWELLDQRTLSGHWVGELSASALSTATAISAMSAVLLYSSDPNPDAETLVDCVTRGIESLAKQQNPDGGFGDTDRSHSNIATSYLVLAASSLAEQGVGRSLALEQSEALRDYIRDVGEFDCVASTLRRGQDVCRSDPDQSCDRGIGRLGSSPSPPV